MATRTGRLVKQDDNYVVATWEGFAGDGDDVGTPLNLGLIDGLCLQIIGTLGDDGSLVIEGSNDGITYGPLHDLAGNALTALTALGFYGPIAERPLYIRPRQLEGEPAVTDLDVILVGTRRGT